MPAPNFLPLPRVTHPKHPGQMDRLPTLPGPCPGTGTTQRRTKLIRYRPTHLEWNPKSMRVANNVAPGGQSTTELGVEPSAESSGHVSS